MRTPSSSVWEQLPAIFERAVAEILEGTGADYELEYTHGVPPVVNDPEVTDVVRAAARAEFGDRAISSAIQSWGGDDFAWYLREVPGSYVRVGVTDPSSAGPRLDLHSGSFDVDETVIGLAIRLMIATQARFGRP